MQKKFRYPKFSETLKGCPRNFSALWDKKFPTEKRDTTLFIHKVFWKQKFSRKHWDFLTKVFGTVRNKNFDWKSWYAPSYPWIFFDTRKFPGNRKVPLKIFSFRSCGTKSSVKTVKPPPSNAWKEFFWNIKVFSNEIFGYSETKTSTENRDTPLPYPNFFDTRNYYNSKGLPYGNFRHCDTKNFRRKFLIIPPPHPFSLIQTFSVPEISETKDSPLRKDSALWDKKFSKENLEITLWCIKFFDTRN